MMLKLTLTATVKSDSSLLFRKLKELKTLHRIILTGVRFGAMLMLDPY